MCFYDLSIILQISSPFDQETVLACDYEASFRAGSNLLPLRGVLLAYRSLSLYNSNWPSSATLFPMPPTTSTTLPIFPLDPPNILLPASRLTLPIKKEHGHALITLIQESDAQPGPIVAAFPVLNSADDKNTPVLNEWGTAARVVRLIRPSALTPSQPYLVLLHGLTRVKLAKPLKLNHNYSLRNLDGDDHGDSDGDALLLHPVQYPPIDTVPNTEVVDAFKGAAIRLLDRLAQDTGAPARRDAWTRFAAMVDDVSEKRAGWLADVLVGAVSGEYSDRLGMCTFLFNFLIYLRIYVI